MSSRVKKSPSVWREFEQLVARIEHALAGTEVVVKSPDRIPSRVTARKREVDASLRARIGSAELLVTIECRKRSATQDVTWIDQIACKKEAIGASRTIAVASTPFSAGAIAAATYYGIDLRVLAEIADSEIQSWAFPPFVMHVYKSCDLIERPEIVFDQQSSDNFVINPAIDNDTGMDAAVFLAQDGAALTLNDLWLRIEDQMKIFETVPKDDKSYIRRLRLTPSDQLLLSTRLGPRRVHEIRMALSLRWKHERVLLREAKVISYAPGTQQDSMPLQGRAEFESKGATKMNVRFGVQLEQGGDRAILSIEALPVKK